MLTLNQVLKANRPLIYTVAESDVEVLLYLKQYNENIASSTRSSFYVYSSTFVSAIPLERVVNSSFKEKTADAKSLTNVLSDICQQEFSSGNIRFHKYVFLDCHVYINDAQNVRLIKDIISRYQMDSTFVVSLIFVSHIVSMPSALERLSEVVFFDLPDEKQLNDLSAKTYKGLKLDPKDKDEIALNLKGLTLFEAEQALLQSHSIYRDIDLSFIRNFKKNSIAKTNLLSLMEKNIVFDEIAGMDRLKAWLKKSAGGWTIEGQKYGLPVMKGVLLIGPAGTGKSMIAKSLGNEWNLPVIFFDPSRIYSSGVGDSENNMRRVLKIIEGIAPCVVMIDEMEKGFSGSQSSTYSDAGVTSKVLGIFLTWFNDCEKPVFIIGTSNNIEQMPPELLSRFDEIFFVNLPQDFEREDIFRIHLKKRNRDPGKFNLKSLSEKSVDLSGREIEQVIRESLYDSFHAKRELDTEAILNVLAKKTSIIRTKSEEFKDLLDWVGYDKEKNDGIRARFANTISSLSIDRVNSEIDKLLKDVEGKKPFES